MNRRGFSWATESTEHYNLYYETDSMTANSVAAVRVEAEREWEQVLKFLGIQQYEERVSIFLVESKKRMKDLNGLSVSATGFSQSNTICLIPHLSPPSNVGHELLHIMAMNNWSIPDRWINEGLAVAYGGQILEFEIHALAKHLLERDQLPSVYELTHRFTRLQNRRSYPAAGSFVRFLYDHYGLTTVRKIWDSGISGLEQATGVSMHEIEQDWLQVVREANSEGIVFDEDP